VLVAAGLCSAVPFAHRDSGALLAPVVAMVFGTAASRQSQAIVDIEAVAPHATIQYVNASSINNSQTWVELPPTFDAHTTVSGLPVVTTVLFRWPTLLDGVYGASSPSLPYQVT